MARVSALDWTKGTTRESPVHLIYSAEPPYPGTGGGSERGLLTGSHFSGLDSNHGFRRPEVSNKPDLI